MSDAAAVFCIVVVALIIMVGGAYVIHRAPQSAEATRIENLIDSQPTLADRLVEAFKIDPDGWTGDHYRMTYRGKFTMWIANGPEFLGDDLSATMMWPYGDHRYDDDRAKVWRAFEDWYNARAFTAIGK